MHRVEVAFDYISPYAYLAWCALPSLVARHGASLEPSPVLFAGLLEANGTKGPAEIPRKRTYLFHDVSRSAAVLGVPIAPPPTHPFRPLLALRVTLAARAEDRARVVDALFRATWGGGGGCDTEDAIERALDGTGLDTKSLLLEAGRDPVKQALRSSTERALARGAFGVPTMFVDDQIFWGLDSLPHLDRYLGGDARMKVDAASVARWEVLPSSAQRAR